MSTLTEKEFLLINDIVRELHSLKNINDVGKIFLTMVRKLIPYSSANFSIMDSENILYVDPKRSVYVDTDEENIEDYNKYVYMDYTNPAFSYPKSASFRDSDMISEEEKEQTDFYNEWCIKNNIKYSGGVIIKTPKGNVICSNFFRSRYNGPFSDREMMIFDMFIGHLEDIAAKFLDSSTIVQKLPKEYTDDKRYNMLSNREKEIFPYVLERYSNEEISNKFCISISTVKKHRHSIFKKFDVVSRQELIDSLSDAK